LKISDYVKSTLGAAAKVLQVVGYCRIDAFVRVYDNLKTKTTNVFNYSKDGATISDCYEQLDKIPLELDKPNAHVFISAGGNNILNARNKMTSENIIQLFKW
jgi:hypothetical protein